MPDAVFVHQVSSLASFFQIPPCDGHPCLAMRLVLPPPCARDFLLLKVLMLNTQLTVNED